MVFRYDRLERQQGELERRYHTVEVNRERAQLYGEQGASPTL